MKMSSAVILGGRTDCHLQIVSQYHIDYAVTTNNPQISLFSVSQRKLFGMGWRSAHHDHKLDIVV